MDVAAGRGESTSTSPDGTLVTVTSLPDDRLGFEAGHATVTTKLPSGLTRTTVEEQESTGAVTTTPWVVGEETTRMKLNGKTMTLVRDNVARTITATTPVGRVTTTHFDVKGRTTEIDSPAVLPITITYDTNGRLDTITQGTRTTTMTYGSDGRLASVEDALGRTVSMTRDAVGRVLTQTLPDASEVAFAFDDDGNLSSLTPPGKPAHDFAYDAMDQEVNYSPPDLALYSSVDTQHAYDLDRRPTSETRPNGDVLQVGYDAAGRVGTVTTPEGTTTMGYSSTTGQLATVTAYNGQTLAYTYDGALVTSETLAGGTSGTVSVDYDNDFKPTNVEFNGTGIALGYDQDNLLTSAGALTIDRETTTGRVATISAGSTVETRSYSGYGELEDLVTKYGTTTLYDELFTRDALGRIATKEETIGGVTTTYEYGYDMQGRLHTVTTDSSLTTTYDYDTNGNRLARTRGAGVEEGIYDDQDRAVSYGNFAYTYDAHGTLTSKTDVTTSDETLYDYDSFGNLVRVDLPDETVIEYVVDGRNRRVAKKVDGTVVKRWVWQGQLQPIAELDGAGNLVSRFVYATGINVPDFMVRGGVTYRFVRDHLGSVRLVVNAGTGAVVQRLDYDEYGVVTTDTNPGWQPFGYAGGLWETSTELVRFGARDYDAASGRWTAKDETGFDGDQTDFYAYCFDDPVNYFDAEGLNGKRAAEWAKKQVGDLGYSYGASSPHTRGTITNYADGRGTNKCNAFVYDALKEGKNSAGRMPDGRIPTATEWETGTVGGYYTLPAGTAPATGDVVAMNGHVGIYLALAKGKRGTVSAAAGWFTGVVHNDWGFRPGDKPTIKRCECDR